MRDADWPGGNRFAYEGTNQHLPIQLQCVNASRIEEDRSMIRSRVRSALLGSAVGVGLIAASGTASQKHLFEDQLTGSSRDPRRASLGGGVD